MSSKILKEIFIIILLFIVVMFTIGILLYEFIPRNEEVSSVEYEATDKVLGTISEIQSKIKVDNSIDNNTGALLKSYSITKDDLSDYKNQNYYESGKKDPFAEYSETVEDEVISTTKIDTENKTSNTVANITVTNTVSSSNTITYNIVKEDKSTNTATESQNTTGTYFEKKNSK